MSTYAERIEVFEDTIAWINADSDLSASVDQAKKNTSVYYEDDYPSFDSSKKKDTTIAVSGDRSYQAAKRLRKMYPNTKIAVMNFANAFHAGGGVTKGSGAQEESLCRTSTLYPLLYRRTLRDSFYQHHKDLNTPKASDSLIYTEGVIICKTDEDLPKRMPKEDWVTVDVITIAAPDLRDKSNPHAPLVNGGTYMNDAELFGYHVKRAIHMLTCAAAKGADILVLGAFGCGAFQNNPEVVARAYKTALQEFPKVFSRIEFAVHRPPTGSMNYDVFKRVLGSMNKGSIFEGILGLEEALKNDSFGEVIRDTSHKGTLDDPLPMPYIRYSETVKRFVKEVYSFDDNNPEYELKQYGDTLAKYGVNDVPLERIDVSNMDDRCMMALFMGLVREEHFCDGIILDAMKSGIVQRWIARLKEIRGNKE